MGEGRRGKYVCRVVWLLTEMVVEMEDSFIPWPIRDFGGGGRGALDGVAWERQPPPSAWWVAIFSPVFFLL